MTVVQQRFEQFIRSEHLFPDGGQVLLAVSGGRDSVALTHLVATAGIPFAIAHCNFHLRPGDSDRDEAFVRSLAQHYDVPCFVASFDTNAYAAANHLSIEEAARIQRYDFFHRVLQQQGFSVIATAHHRDDTIETFFINLLRGTGIEGLRGIPLRNGNVVRPLLPFGRSEIDNYIAANHLNYVDDYTNSQQQFLRNRIRHQLIPLLRSLSPSFDATMQSNISHLTDAADIYRQTVDSQLASLMQPDDNGYRIDIHSLEQLSPLSTWLYELLHPFGFSSAIVSQVQSSLYGHSGIQFLSHTHRLVKDRNALLLRPLSLTSDESYLIPEPSACAALPIPLSMRLSHYDGRPIRLKSTQAWFDNDRLHYPLTLRPWRNGDRFVPFGMKGSRLVSDLLTDLKLSLPEKEKVRLLCDGDGTVLWVVGLRAASMAPVVKTTITVLQVEIEEL